MKLVCLQQLKAIGLLQAFEDSVGWALLHCDYSNLHMSVGLFK